MGVPKIHRIISVFILVVLFLLPNGVLALSAGGMSIMPQSNKQYPNRGGWFLYEVDPGEIINDTVRVTNTKDTSIFVTLEGIDAFLLDDGAFALRDTSSNEDIGTWIELEETEFELKPNSSKIVPFVITVPEDAEVGDHIGGLAVYETSGEPEQVYQSGGTKVGITTRVGARIYLTVAGDIIRDLNIKKRYFFGRADKMMFKFILENKGNVRANLTITEGKIYNIFGLYDEQQGIVLGQIFPHKTVTKIFPWPGKNKPLFGPYLAIFTIEDTYKKVNPRSNVVIPEVEPVTVWLFTFFVPYTQIAVIAGLLFLIWFIWQFIVWKRLSNLARRPVAKYKVKKGDNLMSISHDFGVSWKIVAKLNNIKPPYSLYGIKTLYIPDVKGSKMDIDTPHFLGFIWKPLVKLFIKHPWPRPAPAGRPTVSKPESDIIIIEKGDTKKDIEKFTGMKWSEIAALNKLKPSFRLRAGQELVAPIITKKPSKKKLESDIIIIEKGDTKKDIEKFTGMKWSEIAALNKLKPSFRLRAGQELIAPSKKKPLRRKKK